MDHPDRFDSISRHTRVEIPKIKGSRFIADASPASSEDRAKTWLTRVSSEFPDATHHCFAFSVEEGRTERSSDAGEPGGTAGAPILRQIQSSGLTNIIVVVTRYYGGTNLGKGGLIRAYGSAAKAVIEACPRVTHVREALLRIQFDYDDTSPAMRIIERFGARILSSDYSDRSAIDIALPVSDIDGFETEFRDALGGRGSVETL